MNIIVKCPDCGLTRPPWSRIPAGEWLAEHMRKFCPVGVAARG